MLRGGLVAFFVRNEFSSQHRTFEPLYPNVQCRDRTFKSLCPNVWWLGRRFVLNIFKSRTCFSLSLEIRTNDRYFLKFQGSETFGEICGGVLQPKWVHTHINTSCYHYFFQIAWLFDVYQTCIFTTVTKYILDYYEFYFVKTYVN